MIGIICAMEVEADAVRALLRDPREETVSGVRFTCGTVSGKDVVLAVCGVGKVYAALCTEAMILKYSPDAIVNVGVAGTLTPELSIGDVAVGTAAVCHDMDTSPFGDPPGFISGIGVFTPLSEDLAERLLEILKEQGLKGIPGVIASGDRFVWRSSDKNRITKHFGAVVCEMEGQAIAQTCFVNRTPCAIIRSVSDNADGVAADFENFKFLAAENAARVITAFLASLSE